jgi:hypothetical protein
MRITATSAGVAAHFAWQHDHPHVWDGLRFWTVSLADLEWTNAELREEIAPLKGLKGRPDIKPGGMDKATDPGKPGGQEKRGRRGNVRPRVSIEDRVLKATAPAGSSSSATKESKRST